MNMKRMRGRNNRGGSSGGGGGPVRHQSGNVPMNRNHVFDSSGPDLRIRGTSQQLFEKYLQLGRDATSVGDRVMAESYFQYAEHYFRILNAMNQAAQQVQAPQYGGQHAQPRRDYAAEQRDYQADQQSDERGDDAPEERSEAQAVETRPIAINPGNPEA